MGTQINLDIATKATLTSNDGNSINFTMRIKDAEDAIVDLTGQDFELRIWGSYRFSGESQKTEVDETIAGVLAGDNLSVSFSKDDTSTIRLPMSSEGEYKYNYTVKRDISGEVAVILEGEFKRKSDR